MYLLDVLVVSQICILLVLEVLGECERRVKKYTMISKMNSKQQKKGKKNFRNNETRENEKQEK